MERREHRKPWKAAILLILLGIAIGTVVGTVALETPYAVTQIQFFNVLTAIATYPRYQRPLPQAEPSIEGSNWSGFSGYYWWHDGAVDWQEVRSFISDLVNANENASWCEYYQISTSPSLQFHWLVWFEELPGSYSFLYYDSGDNPPPTSLLSLLSQPIVFAIVGIIHILIITQIALLYYRNRLTRNPSQPERHYALKF